ncbi:MAG: radical SAM protein [Firmicutes bacterium]|jgi:DNA repair photolyase|nr:radical SAM protein [Bacillota bacterium]
MREILKWQARSLVNRQNHSPYGFDATVNPYRGCAHACHYCYARDTHLFLDLNIGEDFSQKLFVKQRSPEQIRQEVNRLPLDRVIALGTATDPYQPLEGHHRISRRLLEIIADSGHAVTITTKSPLILRDIDLLERLANHHQLRVHISLISLNRDLLRVLEPGAPPPLVRLQTIAELTQHAIPTLLFAAPILPYLTDQEEQLARLFKGASEALVDGVMASRLRLSPTMKSYFFDWLVTHYPDLLEPYRSLYPGSSQYPLASYSQALSQRVAKLQQHYGLSQPYPTPKAWRPISQLEFHF